MMNVSFGRAMTGWRSRRESVAVRRPAAASSRRFQLVLVGLATLLIITAEAADAVSGNPGSDNPPLAADATVQELVDFALAGNPGLAALRQRWRAALAGERRAGKLPEPQLSAGYYLEEVETRVGPQQWRLGISQSFPWFGELSLRSEVAGQEGERRRHLLSAAERALTFRLRIACFEYAFLGAAIETNLENRDLLGSLEKVARNRYRNDELSWSHLLRLQGRSAKLDQVTGDLRDRREREAVIINSLLGRPGELEIGEGLRIPVAVSPATELSPAASLANNPHLLASRAMVEKGQLSLDLAGKQFFPDFTLGMDYIVTGEAMQPDSPGSGADPVILRLGLKLPLWRGSYRAAEQEAAANLRAAAAEKQELNNSLSAQLERTLVDRRRYRRVIELHENDLIPLAQQTLSVSETEFRTGEGSFDQLLEDHQLLLENQLALLRARTDLARVNAEVELLVGSEDGEGSR